MPKNSLLHMRRPEIWHQPAEYLIAPASRAGYPRLCWAGALRDGTFGKVPVRTAVIVNAPLRGFPLHAFILN